MERDRLPKDQKGSLLGIFKKVLDKVRDNKLESRMQLEANTEMVYRILSTNGDFMSAAQIMGETGQSPAECLKGIDILFERELALKRFCYAGISVVVGYDEVRIPEFGYSQVLDNFLSGAGISQRDFGDIEVSYSAISRGDGDSPIVESSIPPSQGQL